MERLMSTGRIAGEVGLATRRVVYGSPTPAELAAELTAMSEVDRAHLVMLVECGLVPREAAARLLECIQELRATSFAAVRDRPMPRGVFMAYEGFLIERLGAEVGGLLHTARSRNDLKATVFAMLARRRTTELIAEAARVQAVLLSKARAHRDVVMPIHTHYQAAMPTTYGHYLLGVAHAVARDLEAMRTAMEPLRNCPLGANAVAGTDLPIASERTAALLGFERGPGHATDAVASRDSALRVLNAACCLTITLSRLATDLQLWSTAEYGFVEFPDRCVGASSAMPQKRNAFLLEHLKAKAGGVIGAWTATASTMKSAPFTNSIEVGTEAVANLWPGLDRTAEALWLSQVVVSGARPNPQRMRSHAEDSFVTATALANVLVRKGVPFRTAHHEVGSAVTAAIAANSTKLNLTDLDLETALWQQTHGGGPGEFDHAHRLALATWRRVVRDISNERSAATWGARELDDAVRRVMTA